MAMIKKRSIVVRNQKTSVTLEQEFWQCLKDIARSRQTTLTELVGLIDAGRNTSNLSSAIRVFVLDHYREPTAVPLAARHETGSQQENSSA
jgi:predicted DNA-binding ribbon-helix-helix protein